jgi:hypothetical protein
VYSRWTPSPDTNLFVSAIGTPDRSLELLLELMEKNYDLVGNTYLLEEYARYSRILHLQPFQFI